MGWATGGEDQGRTYIRCITDNGPKPGVGG
jgi:hypothetical protein